MQPVIRFTTTRDGSFASGELPEVLAARRRTITAHPVHVVHQVHGGEVVVIDPRSEASEFGDADALVCASACHALSVITADCAPVLLASTGVVAAVHAGWRGLAAGVIEAAVNQMRLLGAHDIRAWLGPCIRTLCYEFGTDDLDALGGHFGDSVRGRTSWGTPALDVAEAVRLALATVGVRHLEDTGVCTACSPIHFSHRSRGEGGRQAAFIWMEP